MWPQNSTVIFVLTDSIAILSETLTLLADKPIDSAFILLYFFSYRWKYKARIILNGESSLNVHDIKGVDTLAPWSAFEIHEPYLPTLKTFIIY